MSQEAHQQLLRLGFVGDDNRRALGFMTSAEWSIGSSRLGDQDRAFEKLCEELEALKGTELDEATIQRLVKLQTGWLAKKQKNGVPRKRPRTAKKAEWQRAYDKKRVKQIQADPVKHGKYKERLRRYHAKRREAKREQQWDH